MICRIMGQECSFFSEAPIFPGGYACLWTGDCGPQPCDSRFCEVIYEKKEKTHYHLILVRDGKAPGELDEITVNLCPINLDTSYQELYDAFMIIYEALTAQREVEIKIPDIWKTNFEDFKKKAVQERRERCQK